MKNTSIERDYKFVVTQADGTQHSFKAPCVAAAARRRGRRRCESRVALAGGRQAGMKKVARRASARRLSAANAPAAWRADAR